MALGAEDRVLVSCREGGEVAWHRATVRYVGAVDGQEGTWVGIEWDDCTRGKHDGCVGGTRYFSCRKSETSTTASFVRDKRIKSGITLVRAIKDKYCDDGSVERMGDMYVHTSSNHRLPVFLVGEESVVIQQSRLDILRAIYLSGSAFSSIGEGEDVSRELPRVTDVDVSNTLLSSWGEIVKLSHQFPRLQLLDVSRNEIAWNALGGCGAPSFRNLQTLVMNDCRIGWDQVTSLCAHAPGLTELHVAGNDIKSLACDDVVGCFGNLKSLHLEDNLISSWAEVARLAPLPKLKVLNLANNLIARVDTPHPPSSQDGAASIDGGNDCGNDGGKCGADAPMLQNLAVLFMQNNPMDAWSDVDALTQFKSLDEIKLSGIGLFIGKDMIVARYGVIARLPTLRTLNGSSVTSKEKADAEITYVAEALRQSDLVGEAEAKARYPRLTDLMRIYENVVSAASVSDASAKHTNISKSLLRLKVVHMPAVDSSVCDCIKSFEKKLPSNITLGKFKMLCEKMFKVPARRQIVFTRTDTVDYLRDEEDTLHQLGVVDGQLLHIVDEG